MVVKYEDLLADPAAKLAAAVEFLGVPVDADRIEQTVAAYTADRMRAQERNSQFHERKQRRDIMFVRSARAGDWAETFTRSDEELFSRVTGGLLERLGYGSPS
jgi:DNA-binding NtrC family response regulator